MMTMISPYHHKEESMMMMNRCPLSPLPSQIECRSIGRIEDASISAQRSPLPSLIVDYGMFRAEDEEEEEKQEKLALLREQQQRRRRRRETTPPATSTSTYTRAIEIPCGNKNKNGDDASEDGSSSASEVMFALKVSRPGRLVPRRNRSSISSGWVRRRRGRGNSISKSNSGLNQRSFNGVVAMPSDMSLMSLFEESMTFRQEQEQQLLLEEEKQEEDPTDLDNDDLLLDELLRDDLPPSPAPLMGDFSQTCCHHNNNNNNNNHNLSNSTNMNHDSFQSTEEGTIHPQHKRSNKMRKIMMNWLANQVATRHLLAAGSSSSCTTSTSSVTTPFVPPTFVKVIYWNDNENQLHINNKQQQWNHHHHHHGNNANHDDSLQPTMIGLDQSHHNNVASAMA